MLLVFAVPLAVAGDLHALAATDLPDRSSVSARSRVHNIGHLQHGHPGYCAQIFLPRSPGRIIGEHHLHPDHLEFAVCALLLWIMACRLAFWPLQAAAGIVLARIHT